jgi:hypothetical protein
VLRNRQTDRQKDGDRIIKRWKSVTKPHFHFWLPSLPFSSAHTKNFTFLDQFENNFNFFFAQQRNSLFRRRSFSWPPSPLTMIRGVRPPCVSRMMKQQETNQTSLLLLTTCRHTSSHCKKDWNQFINCLMSWELRFRYERIQRSYVTMW